MVVKGRDFDDIFDLVGIRVIVDSVKDCYAALGTIHATWKPVQGRFKDYVAMPKFNLYQSLHTTVVGPQGKLIEVQLRTREMHASSEFGVAAHYLYKDHHRGAQAAPADIPWLTRIIDWEKDTSDPGEFMANLKIDLDQEEVFVFTPKGEVITLAAGSTPVDFAYAIHTEVGHRCVGAKVNGRLVALSEELHSGDTVEVFTSKLEGAGPSRDWLNFVGTPRAASKIKQWFSRERREDSIATGQDAIHKALRREGLPVQKIASGNVLDEVAEQLNYADLNALYAAVGENHVSAKSIAGRVSKAMSGEGVGETQEKLPVTARRPSRRPSQGPIGVHVEGLDDVLIRLARCCTPVPGDAIMGFVTRGRGVSVHRGDCANAVSLATSQDGRLIDVEWDSDGDAANVVASVEIKALDRSRLLSDVSAVLSEHHVNILACSTSTGGDRVARLRFDFEIADPSHLTSLLRAVRKVDSVYDAYRVLPGRGA
jgi:GTP diphosphokinase / guanosine-3',5'-bis(diphosphate) 3'-diphosphatase